MAGKKEDAEQLLKKISENAETGYIDPILLVLLHGGLQQTDLAFEWLDKAIDARSPQLSWLQGPGWREFWWKNLYRDPRFDQYLIRMEFPDQAIAAINRVLAISRDSDNSFSQ